MILEPWLNVETAVHEMRVDREKAAQRWVVKARAQVRSPFITAFPLSLYRTIQGCAFSHLPQRRS